MSNAFNSSRRTFLAGAGAAWLGASLGSSARAEDKSGFRYCLNTSTISGQKLTLQEEIEIAAKAGYTALEPWTREIDVVAKAGPTALKDLGKLLADKGLAVDSVIGFFDYLNDDEAKRTKGLEQAKRDMDNCAQIGAKRIAAPPVGVTGVEMPIDKCTERYKVLCELGEKMGVPAELELWGFSKTLCKLHDAVKVVKDCGHPQACLLLDVFHLHRGGNNFADMKSVDASKITCFHMNDFPADPPVPAITDAHRIYPGDGVAPLTQLFKDLRANGFKGVLSLELFNRNEWKRDALTVAKIGLEKMQAAVAKSL
ncbi:MAG TPA: sugar phosphate isomerase/epimerase family protein [Planctomycetota bacterium]|nr:sugar phosphate isomerase/epimerase family protein [Planctomycetota bacterium]